MKYYLYLVILILVFIEYPTGLIAQEAKSSTLKAITGAHIFDIEQKEIISNGVILLENDRIKAVGNKLQVAIPPEAEIIDASDQYIIPGLVDAHIHLFQSGGIYTRPDVFDLRKYRPYEEERRWVNENAEDQLKRYLACGITTAIDLGGPMANYTLRDSLNQNPASATVYLTGTIVSTYQPANSLVEDPPIIKVNSETEARELVRKQIPFRPNLIKIYYIARNEQMAKDNYGIMRAAIDEAQQHGLQTAAHATQLETARLAVKAGTDLLVHSVQDQVVDKEFIALLQQQGTVYCPTLIVSKNYGLTDLQTPDLDPIDFSLANPFALGTIFDMQHLPEGLARWEETKARRESLLKRFAHRDSIMDENLRRLHAAGIPIATGTDAGNIGTLHATSFFDELEAMKRAGLSNWQILEASTLYGAKALDREKEFGSLSAGKRADLVVLNKNPLESLAHLMDIAFVIHQGETYYPQELLRSSPEEIVQQQLNAYNAHNIDAFLAPYSENIKVFRFPNELRYTGKTMMREEYSALFKRRPNLHCELVNRIVLDNMVIDQERITAGQSDQVREAVAIYKVLDGKISEVYFQSKQ